MATTVEDVTGKGAGKAISIQQTSRRVGARFALRGKALLIGVVAIMICGAFFGIYWNNVRKHQGVQADEEISDAPGLTHPDVGIMQKAVPQPKSVASATPMDNCEQYNNSPWPCAPQPQTLSTISDAEKKYRDWMLDQSYQIRERRVTDQLAAYQADLHVQGGGNYASDQQPKQTSQVSDAGQDQTQPATRTPARASVAQAETGNQAGASVGASASDLQSAYLKSLGGGNTTGVDSNKAWQQDVGSHASTGGYLPATRRQALGDYELFAGSIIPATMITAIDSDLPGTITASVRRTIYDSRDPTIVLVPQGAKLVGEYNSMVQYGQQRLMVIWNELIFPDGSTLDLKGMSGVDQIGEAGFYDQVNNHYLRVFGSAIMISLFGAAAQLSQPQNSSAFTSSSMSNQATANLATQLDTAATNILNKNLNIAPTLNIRPGYPFNVMVNKTIIMQPWGKDE